MGNVSSLQIIAFLIPLFVTIMMWLEFDNGFTRARSTPDELMVLAFISSLVLLVIWVGLAVWLWKSPAIMEIICFAGIAATCKMAFSSMSTIAGWK